MGVPCREELPRHSERRKIAVRSREEKFHGRIQQLVVVDWRNPIDYRLHMCGIHIAHRTNGKTLNLNENVKKTIGEGVIARLLRDSPRRGR